MRKIIFPVLALAALQLPLPATPARADGVPPAVMPSAKVLRYDVLRDGDKIGIHEFRFKQTGNALDVAIKTDVRVKLGFITLYRFVHDATEHWVDGAMNRMASKTDDDGTDNDLAASLSSPSFAVKHNKKTWTQPAPVIPASLWHRGILDVPATFNTIDGSMMKIKVTPAGTDQVPAPKTPVAAKHYVISGELERELWFDDKNNLVKVRFKGQDKSDIQYVLSAE